MRKARLLSKNMRILVKNMKIDSITLMMRTQYVQFDKFVSGKTFKLHDDAEYLFTK